MYSALHVVAPGRNVGDNLLIQGVHNAFQSVFDFKIFPLNTRVITPEVIRDEINTKDALFIGGGGLLHRSPGFIRKGQDWSGTLIRIKPEHLDLIKVPIIVYGVGYNTFNGELDLNDTSRKFITKLAHKAIHFSVRNDGSLDRLHSFMGNDLPILEVPDPGIFCSPLLTKPVINRSSPLVMFQLAADRLNYRLGGESSDFLVQKIRKVVSYLESAGAQVRFMPHTRDDFNFLETHHFESMPLMTEFDKASRVMGYYKEASLVYAMRGHGVICPFSVGVHTVGISTHPKIEGWYNTIGFPRLSLRLEDNGFVENAIKLFNGMRLGNDGQEFFNMRMEIVQRLRREAQNRVREINAKMSSMSK